jgi:hypothetical protein
MMTKGERVAELVHRLEDSPPATSADEALARVTAVLDEIEDQHSGVPNDPTSAMADERIWPPIAKYHFEIPGRPDLDGYRQRATRPSSGPTEPS